MTQHFTTEQVQDLFAELLNSDVVADVPHNRALMSAYAQDLADRFRSEMLLVKHRVTGNLLVLDLSDLWERGLDGPSPQVWQELERYRWSGSAS